jgi:hypothetical protein
VDDVDLNTFEFDYDLTFMVFFLNANGKVYARYGWVIRVAGYFP